MVSSLCSNLFLFKRHVPFKIKSDNTTTMKSSQMPRRSFEKLQGKHLQLFIACYFLPSDFLPLKCDACEQLFCTDHIAYAHHNCTSAYKKVSKTGGNQIIPNFIEYNDSMLYKAQRSRTPLLNGSCSFCNLS